MPHRIIKLTPLVALSILISVSACQTPDASAVLDLGGDKGSLCLPVGSSREVTYGFDGFSNTSDKPVTIVDVSLNAARGFDAVASYVAEIPKEASVGAVGAIPNWPLTPEQTRGIPDWFIQPASGFEVKSAVRYNLVIHLSVMTLPADFSSVEVTYVDGLGEHTQHNSTSFRVVETFC